MSYGLVIKNSTDFWIYSTGLYSFFQVWSQACLTGQPSCQLEMIKITDSKAIHAYAISTYGSVYIETSNQSYSQASANSNTFCATGIVDLNFF